MCGVVVCLCVWEGVRKGKWYGGTCGDVRFGGGSMLVDCRKWDEGSSRIF